jgi:glutathione S-transferase
VSVTAPYGNASGTATATARLITLFVDGYFVNQWDASVMCALEEKQLAYSTARALLRDGGGVTPALAARTNIGRVPAIQHGDVWLSESNAIIEYLEEMFPAPSYPRLLPADVHARAKARQWMAFVRSDVIALRTERSWWMCVYPASVPASLPAMSREAERDARELVDVVTRLWTAGELDPAQWNMGHADLALTLLRLARTGYPLTDAAKQFLDVNVARPSMRAYLEHPRPPNPPPDAHAAG